jgi:hypothetical protein
MSNNELNNHEINESISRWVREKVKAQLFIKTFLAIIKKMPVTHESDFKSVFSVSIKSLEKIISNNLGIKDLVERIDVMSWFQSKLESKKIIDVYKKKHQV